MDGRFTDDTRGKFLHMPFRRFQVERGGAAHAALHDLALLCKNKLRVPMTYAGWARNVPGEDMLDDELTRICDEICAQQE